MKHMKTVPLTAISPSRWDPVVDPESLLGGVRPRLLRDRRETAKPTNPEGLDELRIARIAGADGLRPYLTRRGRYASGVSGQILAPPRGIAPLVSDHKTRNSAVT